MMKTSSIKAFKDGSERGLGDEMACRKNMGRNTAPLDHTLDMDGMDVHLLEASSLRALAAPLSLCSRRLTRMS